MGYDSDFLSMNFLLSFDNIRILVTMVAQQVWEKSAPVLKAVCVAVDYNTSL